MKLSVARVEVLTWVLIYGGLLLLAVGLALRGVDAALGAAISVGAIVMAVVGAFLIGVRARMVRRTAARQASASSLPPP
ncbi:MAG TPA: hypothetical protein VF319_11280 [Caldimonas sp.]